MGRGREAEAARAAEAAARFLETAPPQRCRYGPLMAKAAETTRLRARPPALRPTSGNPRLRLPACRSTGWRSRTRLNTGRRCADDRRGWLQGARRTIPRGPTTGHRSGGGSRRRWHSWLRRGRESAAGDGAARPVFSRRSGLEVCAELDPLLQASRCGMRYARDNDTSITGMGQEVRSWRCSRFEVALFEAVMGGVGAG